jgi:MFS transporter, PPP family, 3-phenylpropionic acid transporter
MPGERRAIIAAYFLMFWGAGVWAPYFPLYLSHLGFAGWQIGVLIGIQPALRWSSAIGWAYVADRWRVRHRVLVLTAFGGLLFFIPLLVVRHFAAMLVVLAGIGLLHGTLVPMLDATVMDHLPRLGDDYGRLRLWGSVAFVGGSLVSAPLIHTFSAAIVPLLVLLPGIGLVPALLRVPHQQVGHAAHFHAPWRLLTPPLTLFLATAFLIQLSSGGWGGFFAVHTAALGFSEAVPGITWGLAVTAEVAMLFWGRRIIGWIAPAQLIVVVLVITVARWVLTAWAHNELLVVGLQLGHAFTFSAFHLAALLLIARLVPPESSTGGQALYGMVGFGFGGSTGLLLAGALVDRIGTRGVFGFEAVLALLGFVPALRLRRIMRN